MNGIDKFIEEAKDYGTNPRVQKEILRNVVTAEILSTMKSLNIKKADLAKLLNTSPPNITQMLNGNRNLTLDSLCEIALILGKKVQVTFVSDYTDEEIKKYVRQQEIIMVEKSLYENSNMQAN